MRAKDIFEYITTQEGLYKKKVQINDVWDWGMREHIEDRSIYKNSNIRGDKKKGTINEVPIKNIMRPILNLKYRAEDIDVKDITLYIDDPELYHLSFLVKKYHDDVYVLENDLDTFFDQVKESKIDLGGGLAKNIGKGKPEYVPLESIAFCDQSSIMNAPIGLLHKYSPAQLKEFEKKGWGNKDNGATTTIDDLITIVANDKGDIPGPDIKVYEVHGVLPNEYLDDQRQDQDEYKQQFQVVTFYKDEKGNRQGLILYRKESKNPFKMVTTEEIFNRSLGWGGIEELMESQVWVNYDEVVKKDFLDSASKTIIVTDDPTIVAKHPSGMKDMDNLEFLELQEGKTAKVLDTYPRNIALFEQSVVEWQEHAKDLGSAPDALQGKQPPSGTPFRLEERVVQEGKGIHKYRRGKYAKWIEEVYRDWIIPYIAKKITEGTKFLAELSLDELQMVAESVSIVERNKMVKKKVLEGRIVTQEEADAHQLLAKENFMKGGTKQFIEILKDELKDMPIKIKINVAGKQNDLGLMADKITNIFRQIFANPEGFMQVMAIPGAAKSFNAMLEYSGMNPMDFSFVSSPQEMQEQMNNKQPK
uniref:Uncharacterized protein n=1 Tax=viral metagenome TaxID=1070528 RepID=A0A6H1ZZQ1_9ZZZZ